MPDVHEGRWKPWRPDTAYRLAAAGRHLPTSEVGQTELGRMGLQDAEQIVDPD